MIELFLASGNAHKAVEFSELFDTSILKVLPSPEKVEVVEDGESFNENALKKAEGFSSHLKGAVVLSDDSGLVVESLPGELGLHSARFGGEGLTDKQRAELLLKKMEGVEQRKAYFVCVLCFYFSSDEVFFFEGRLFGQIAKEYKGEHGFGYDPVFIPDGAPIEGDTIAMQPEWKNANSHRANACKLAQKFFKERDCQNS